MQLISDMFGLLIAGLLILFGALWTLVEFVIAGIVISLSVILIGICAITSLIL